MLGLWMLYVVAVSAFVGGAALVLERGAARSGRPLRWIWACAFAAVPVVVAVPGPAIDALWPGGPTGILPTLAPEGSGRTAPGGAFAAADAAAPVEAWLLAAWVVGAGLLLSGWGVALVRTRRALRRWPGVDLPGGRVLVSRAVGPAVVGVLRNRVVVPRWCLGLPPEQRDLVLAHEREHVWARDTLMLGVATVFTLFMPWNLPFWAYLRRLRSAVELDCDARVVRARPHARREYGELLIAMASRRRVSGLTFATFSQDSWTLRRRIRMLSRNSRGISRPQALLLVVGGFLLLAGACLVPGPDREGAGPTGPESPPAQTELSQEPVFTPFEVHPELQNLAEVQRLMRTEYPAELREAGVGGSTTLHVFIDEEGRVLNTGIAESSGIEELDDAAARVAARMQFSPALNRGEPVRVWIEVPITLATR